MEFIAARDDVEGSPGMVRQMNASTTKVVEISKKSSSGKKEPGRGAAKLREAANEILSRDSTAIAEALSNNGRNGNLQSAKFMYELSEAGATTDDEEDGRNTRSMALELANAPRWTGPLPSEMDDEMDEDAIE
ncbi:MAG TPA: hypothetical protein VGI45_04140 [Terracidiphilus sp.]